MQKNFTREDFIKYIKSLGFVQEDYRRLNQLLSSPTTGYRRWCRVADWYSYKNQHKLLVIDDQFDYYKFNGRYWIREIEKIQLERIKILFPKLFKLI